MNEEVMSDGNVTEQCKIPAIVSSADYKHIWQLMDELNTIMWESYMIKGKDFGRQEGYKIMGLLEQWAERHFVIPNDLGWDKLRNT